MAKLKSNTVFDLIKSLSGAERRQYKLMAKAGKNEPPLSYALFEAIEDQSQYDEDEIFRVVRHRIKTKAHLQVQKSLLIGNVLKAMRQMHLNADNAEVKLANDIFDARFLVRKKLFGEAKSLLKRTKNTAYRYERYFHLLAIIRCENDILFSEQNIHAIRKHADVNAQEAIRIQKIIAAYYEIQRMDLIVQTVILKTNFNRSDKDKKRDLEIYRTFLKSDAFEPWIIENLFEARLFQFTLQNIHDEALQSISGSPNWKGFHGEYVTFLKAIEREDKTHLLETYEERYFGILYGYLRHANNTTLAWALEALSRFKKAKFYRESIVRRQKLVSFRMALRLSYVQGDKAEFKKVIREYSPFIQSEGQFLSPDDLITLYSYIGQSYLMHHDYINAESATKKILLIAKNAPEIRVDLIEVATLLLLIIAVETGNKGKIYRTITKIEEAKSKDETSFDFILIHFAKKSLTFKTEKEQRDATKELFKALRSNAVLKTNKILMTYFDFLGWYQAKIGNRSFIEITRKRNGIE